MATTKLSDEALLAFFQSYPNLRDRVASIMAAVGNLDGDLGEADRAEERLVEEMRLLGREALQGWPTKGSRRRSGTFSARPGCTARVKKTLLAHKIRPDHGPGATIQARKQPRAPLCSRRQGQSSRVFATFATNDHGFRGRQSLRPGPVEIARALRLRDRRKHDPEDHTGPCPGHFQIRPPFAGISASARSAPADRRPDRRGHGPDRAAGREAKGPAQGEKTVVERGEDLARARQGKPHAGLWWRH